MNFVFDAGASLFIALWLLVAPQVHFVPQSDVVAAHINAPSPIPAETDPATDNTIVTLNRAYTECNLDRHMTALPKGIVIGLPTNLARDKAAITQLEILAKRGDTTAEDVMAVLEARTLIRLSHELVHAIDCMDDGKVNASFGPKSPGADDAQAELKLEFVVKYCTAVNSDEDAVEYPACIAQYAPRTFLAWLNQVRGHD